jgi:HTH-type transcriptional regulator/antitoxin HigA
MAKKMIRPIRSEADYDAALEEIERCSDDDRKPGTPDADRFDLLALIVEGYKRKRWPIEPPDTIDAIRYRMEAGGYTQADLGHLLGSTPACFRHPHWQAPPHHANGLAAAPRSMSITLDG